MVGRLFVRGTRRLSRKHRGHNFSGKRRSIQILHQKKINGKISTEDEMIGVDKIIAKILLSRYFIEAEGYNISHNKLMGDNKSAIFLKRMESSPDPNRPILSILGIYL